MTEIMIYNQNWGVRAMSLMTIDYDDVASSIRRSNFFQCRSTFSCKPVIVLYIHKYKIGKSVVVYNPFFKLLRA